MKRILLPTDFSENAWHAIRYALSLFRNQDCEFFILNTFQVGTSGLATKRGRANQTRFYRLLHDQSELGLDKVLKKIEELGPNPKHKINKYSLPDHLVNAAANMVKSKEIDLIVMGTKGATGLKEVFMGSNAHKVVKHIHDCPTILVPSKFEVEDNQDTLVLATGFEHLFNSQELKPVLEFSEKLGSKVWVVFVGEESDLTAQQLVVKQELSKQLNAVTHEFVFVEKEGSVNETLQKMISENSNVHMVAMVNYWHSFFEKLTREPVIKKVSFNLKVPFLVIHLFE